MTDEKQPKSVRLTKAHREDTVRAVMQQWEKTNPPPEGGDTVSLIRDVIGTAAKGYHNPRKPSDRVETEAAVFNVLDRTAKVAAALEYVGAEYKKHLRVRTEQDWRIEVRGDDGQPQSSIQFKVPAALADELGLPYFETDKIPARSFADSCRCDNKAVTPENLGSLWPYVKQYGEYEDYYIECAVFVNESSFITVPVKSKSNVMKHHQRAERERRLWAKQREQMFEEVRDLMDQFNTTKQLRENWPDIVPYLPPHVADPAAAVKLPVLEVSRLNERLGISDA